MDRKAFKPHRVSLECRGAGMTEAIECPTCGADARENSRLHCTSKCPWIICTNGNCRTVYQWDDPSRYFM